MIFLYCFYFHFYLDIKFVCNDNTYILIQTLELFIHICLDIINMRNIMYCMTNRAANVLRCTMNNRMLMSSVRKDEH